VNTPLRWSSKALGDLARLHAFLAEVNPEAAAKAVQTLTRQVRVLRDNPRLGTRLSEHDPREVRRLIISSYEVRYEIAHADVTIVRVWYTREDR
jgi:plasmid stabilization system protein ParE